VKTDIAVQIRLYRGAQDVPSLVEIANAEFVADGVPHHESVEDNLAYVRHPSDTFDATRDLSVAEIDGSAVGYAERQWVDTNDGLREYRINGSVLPEMRRRGIGTALLADNERRSRDLAATHETDRPKFLGSWSNDRQAGRIALLRENGYEPVRWFFDMTRPLSQPIPDAPMPDGLEVRPVTMDNIRAVWRADTEAFKDHWGGFDASEARLQSWMESPSFDPTLWVIAWDGDEVAGGVINGIDPEENKALGLNRGWLHSVFTRRQWRKRGLANALIVRSLQLLKDRGIADGTLGVDANNPTGALGLYERNSFTVAERSTAWRKPL